MSELSANEIYWTERLAAAAFELGVDFPRDLFEQRLSEEAQSQLLEWYMTPGRWIEILISRLWAEDGTSNN